MLKKHRLTMLINFWGQVTDLSLHLKCICVFTIYRLWGLASPTMDRDVYRRGGQGEIIELSGVFVLGSEGCGSMRSNVGRPVDSSSSLSMSASLTLGERIDPRVPLEQQK